MTVFETAGGVKLKVRTPLGSAGPASPHPSAGLNMPKLAVNIPESANRVAAEPLPLVTCLHDTSSGQGAIGWSAATSTASKVVESGT